jgi:hypothetical protein
LSIDSHFILSREEDKMIPPDAVRVIEFSKEDIEACNTEHFVQMFTEISQIPQKAKMLRGKVVLGFSVYDNDPRPNYAIPEIREFVQSIHKALPHFPYFVAPDPSLQQILIYLLCLIPIDVAGGKFTYSSHDLMHAVDNKTIEIGRFCEKIADNINHAVEGLILNLPPQFLKQYPIVATKALRDMRPILQALLDDFTGAKKAPLPQHITEEQVRMYIDTTLDYVADLTGLAHSDYPSKKEFLEAVLQRISEQIDATGA